jgi:hypothetical protein
MIDRILHPLLAPNLDESVNGAVRPLEPLPLTVKVLSCVPMVGATVRLRASDATTYVSATSQRANESRIVPIER